MTKTLLTFYSLFFFFTFYNFFFFYWVSKISMYISEHEGPITATRLSHDGLKILAGTSTVSKALLQVFFNCNMTTMGLWNILFSIKTIISCDFYLRFFFNVFLTFKNYRIAYILKLLNAKCWTWYLQ